MEDVDEGVYAMGSSSRGWRGESVSVEGCEGRFLRTNGPKVRICRGGRWNC
jgi:hypothetical protein